MGGERWEEKDGGRGKEEKRKRGKGVRDEFDRVRATETAGWEENEKESRKHVEKYKFEYEVTFTTLNT